MQVMCVFVAARIITMFSLQYFPILFLKTLNMNEVRGSIRTKVAKPIIVNHWAPSWPLIFLDAYV